MVVTKPSVAINAPALTPRAVSDIADKLVKTPVIVGRRDDRTDPNTKLTDGVTHNNKRIDFIGGARGTSELERLVNMGQAAVAFSLYPVSVDDLMQVCDAGGIMPPKSTWFEPKLRDGLLSHVI